MSEPTIPYEAGGGRAAGRDNGDWQLAARRFALARLRLYGVQTAVGLAFPFLLWYLGWAGGLDEALAGVVSQRWLQILLFVAAYQGISAVLFLPFSWYGGFHLQHRFGLSRQTGRDWAVDWAKSTLLGGVFFLAGMESFYLLIDILPSDWWWVLATGLGLLAVLLTFIAPVLLLPIFYRSSPLEDRELAERIRQLAERAGTRISKVCTIDMSRRTVAANAALTGMGRTRRVLLGDTLLREFSPDEVEAVVAHEIGHHVHGDIWKGVLLEVAGIWAGLFLLQWLVRPGMVGLGLGDLSRLSNLPLLVLLGEVASLATMPLANAISRRHEAAADAFAARLSRNPAAYSDALYRLARQNLSELWPPRWVELLFYTHPAIGRRMARVAEAEGR